VSTKTILDNEFATLVYHTDKQIVHHKFHKEIGGEHFREVLNKGLEVFQQEQASKWLSDDRKNSALQPDDSNWGLSDWSPRVIAAGWKYWAIVMPERVLGQMNMQRFAKAYKEQGVTVQAFSDPDEAMLWLQSQ
jgi:hypothetical protein